MTASLRCLTTLLPTTQVYPGHETTPFTLSDFSL
jgi:hypothetical protein